MVKEQFRETDIANVISHVQFSPFSAKDIAKQATLHVVNQKLYLPDAAHRPCPYGVLDHKLVRTHTHTLRICTALFFQIFCCCCFKHNTGYQREGQEVRHVRPGLGHVHWSLRLHRPRVARLPRRLLPRMHQHFV